MSEFDILTSNKIISFLYIFSCFWKCAFTALNDTDNDSEQSQCTAENFNNQNLHKWVWVLSVSDGATTSWYSYANTSYYFIQYPQSKFERPTEIPVQKIEYPQNIISSEYMKLVSGPGVGNTVIFPCKIMAIMTP